MSQASQHRFFPAPKKKKKTPNTQQTPAKKALTQITNLSRSQPLGLQSQSQGTPNCSLCNQTKCRISERHKSGPEEPLLKQTKTTTKITKPQPKKASAPKKPIAKGQGNEKQARQLSSPPIPPPLTPPLPCRGPNASRPCDLHNLFSLPGPIELISINIATVPILTIITLLWANEYALVTLALSNRQQMTTLHNDITRQITKIQEAVTAHGGGNGSSAAATPWLGKEDACSNRYRHAFAILCLAEDQDVFGNKHTLEDLRPLTCFPIPNEIAIADVMQHLKETFDNKVPEEQRLHQTTITATSNKVPEQTSITATKKQGARVEDENEDVDVEDEDEDEEVEDEEEEEEVEDEEEEEEVEDEEEEEEVEDEEGSDDKE
ncbi:uncharacterized protein MELLADRAFT_96048 [Melampsora larici-populina 98AG31]|uniref:Uncharacterized protein n=1 Tax=Melampsora larici-populina (strain 98AG31 / pathotype 3-4-7) TaxID=747676 RepID=F4SAR8_MELLP|nr:uncharacterized protein MELLADRAFT_96048 [Melampsora larici-populina 98AG31]EGF98263.1 hypothetical protein MELLADRAFT_96048 [Melampsora larici-populina 98AG31]